MADLSVGQVSGILNVVIILIQLTFPLAVVIILISFLIVVQRWVQWGTMSVVTRTLHSSMWASILGTDSASLHGVRKRVSCLGAFSTFGLILLAVAGIVTPLGLDDEVSADSGSIQMVEFEYARDPGPMGQGTPARTGYKFSRLCGNIFLTNCPGQFAGSHSWRNATGYYADREGTMSSKIPKNITDIYISGTMDKGNIISNFFDIQYRYFFDEWKDESDKTERQQVDDGQPYTVGTSRYIETLLLKDGFSVVEGLIVDTSSTPDVGGGPTGVGFRNHTIPKGVKYGATWEEDLLWIEPVTECVDTNLTLEFTVGPRRDNSVLNISLVDNGGFSELDLNYRPYEETANRTQEDPRLRERAYLSAWFNNALTMLALNVTRTTRKKGAIYRPWYNETTGQNNPQPQLFYTNPENIKLLQGGGWYLDLSNVMNNVTASEFTENIEYAMQRHTTHRASRTFDIDSIQSDGGMVVGGGHLVSGRTSLLAAPGTQWSQPMFYCASAIRATIKRVTFHFNQTYPGKPLEKLRVTKIVDKTYSSEAEYPLWAVEKTNMSINEASPLWGIISLEYASKTQHLWTVKAPHLWLPAGHGGLGMLDSTAGTSASFGALTQIWDPREGYGERLRNGYALSEKWQKLSSSVDTVNRIINLLWTDNYAQLVTGTKSTISSYETNPYEKFGLGVSAIHTRSEAPKEEQDKPLFSVHAYGRKITFKMVYGVPAFIVLSLWAIVCIASVILLIGGQTSLPVLKELLNQTSTGRVVTNLAYPDVCQPNAKTKEWVRRAGMKRMGFLRIRNGSTAGTGMIGSSIANLNIPATHNSKPFIQTYHVNNANYTKLQGSPNVTTAIHNNPSSSSSIHTEKSKESGRGDALAISITTTNSTSSSSQYLRNDVDISQSPANPFGSPFSPYGPNSPYSQYPVQSNKNNTSFNDSTTHLIPTTPSPSEDNKNNDSSSISSNAWGPVLGEVYFSHNDSTSLGSKKTLKQTDTGLSEVRLGLIGGRGTPIKNVFIDDGSSSQENEKPTWPWKKKP